MTVLTRFFLLLCIIAVARACSGNVVFNSTSGTFASAHPYGNFASCTWLLGPLDDASNKSLSITFDKVELECSYDYIYVYDGKYINETLLKVLTGFTAETVSTTGPNALVVFQSDVYTVNWGFQASYTMINCPKNCSNVGTCVDSHCLCSTGYTGAACDLPALGIISGWMSVNRWYNLSPLRLFMADSLPNLPMGRRASAMAAIGDYVYIFGGYSIIGNINLNEMWRYSVVTNDWSRLVPNDDWPNGRNHMGIAAAADKFYIYGGQKSQQQYYYYPFMGEAWYSDLWSYNARNSTFSELSRATGPGARVGSACAIHGETVYLFSGYGPGIFPSDLWKFDGSWLLLHNGGPTARVSSNAITHGDNIYVYGGSDNMYRPKSDMWAWSTTNNGWTKLSTVSGTSPPALHEHFIVSVPNGVLLLGGASVGAAYGQICTPSLSRMWLWSTKKSVWSTVEPPKGLDGPLQRRALAATANGTRVYVFGGDTDSSYDYTYNDLWYFDVVSDACSAYNGTSCAACLFAGCGWYEDTQQCINGVAAGPTTQPIPYDARYWFYHQCPTNCRSLTTCSECSEWQQCGWCRNAGSGTQGCYLGDSTGPYSNTTVCDSWSHRTCPATCQSTRQCVACLTQPTCGYCDMAPPNTRCIDGGPQGPWIATTMCNGTTDWHYDPGNCPIHCTSFSNCTECVNDKRCGWCLKSERCMEGSINGPDYPTSDVCSSSLSDNAWVYTAGTCPTCSAYPTCDTCVQTSSSCGWCEKSRECTQGTQLSGSFHIDSTTCGFFEYSGCVTSQTVGIPLNNEVLNANTSRIYRFVFPDSSSGYAGVGITLRYSGVDKVGNITALYSTTQNRPTMSNKDGMKLLVPVVGSDSLVTAWIQSAAPNGVFMALSATADSVYGSVEYSIVATPVYFSGSANTTISASATAGYLTFFRVVLTTSPSTVLFTVDPGSPTRRTPSMFASVDAELPDGTETGNLRFDGGQRNGINTWVSSIGGYSGNAILVGIQADRPFSFRAFQSTPLNLENPHKEYIHFGSVVKGQSNYYHVFMPNATYYLNFTVFALSGETGVYVSTKDVHPSTDVRRFEWGSNKHGPDDVIVWDRSIGFRTNTFYYVAVHGVEHSQYVLYASRPLVADYGWFLENMSTIVLGAIIVLTCMNFLAFGVHRLRLRYFQERDGVWEPRPRGVSNRVMKKLPLVQLSSETWTCAVCLSDQSELNPTTKLMELPCGHLYHPECITPWLKKNRLCPLCKIDVVSGEPSFVPQINGPGQAVRVSTEEIEMSEIVRDPEDVVSIVSIQVNEWNRDVPDDIIEIPHASESSSESHTDDDEDPLVF